MYKLSVLAGLTIICAAFFNVKRTLKSGSAILSTTEDSIGIFSPPGINATPLGVVYLKGRKNPSLFLTADSRYEGMYRYDLIKYKNGVPVFGQPVSVTMPDDLGTLVAGSFCQYNDIVYAFWLKGRVLYETTYDEINSAFRIIRLITITGMPRNPRAVQVSIVNGKLEAFLEMGDGISSNGPVHWIESKNFAAYGPDGIFVGNLTYSGLYGFSTKMQSGSHEVEAKRLTSLKEVMWGYHTLNRISYDEKNEGILTGSVNGNFLYYALNKQSLLLQPKVFAIDTQGIAIRHQSIGARPRPVFDKSGKHLGLIAGGEGGIYFYRYIKLSEKGIPVYADAVPALAYGAELYGGSLVVPNLVDWNGDGKLDIISGNSAGHVLFFKNHGSNKEPMYGIAEYVKAGGQVIHIQPGYNDDIQGPYESRWGYISPTVVDWNGDGLLDIVSNDSRGKHRLFLNRGTKQEPRLAVESPIYLDGLELHGTWRTRPGAARMGDRMAYITQDDEDQFHIYWQLDAYNVRDGGKLQLEDSSYIDGSHFPNGGGSGRNKILIVDWDGDGVKDLLIGTPRHGSIPKRGAGMPYYYGDKGATVVLMKNVGTEAVPVFSYPAMIKYKGETIHFGQHECAPAVGDLGDKNGLDLIVGTETGRFVYYERSDLTW